MSNNITMLVTFASKDGSKILVPPKVENVDIGRLQAIMHQSVMVIMERRNDGQWSLDAYVKNS